MPLDSSQSSSALPSPEAVARTRSPATHAASSPALPIMTASTGNHGQSIALACQRHGVPCTILVPARVIHSFEFDNVAVASAAPDDTPVPEPVSLGLLSLGLLQVMALGWLGRAKIGRSISQ